MLKPYKGIWPKVHESAFIEESAQVIGDVEIGEGSSVWFNAVVRGDVHYIRIGAWTNVQDNCTLHVTKNTYPLIIGNDITIGHNVVLHGCTVKDRCLIGMGAIILDNAEIGEDTIVGAGALVTEGAKIPPGSLVLGMPAKVVRVLRDDEKARILKSAQNYIEYSSNYVQPGASEPLSGRS
ncbi:MAG TPA: gamma carbonic anhydrase family protein [Deltaproteobacteria bacterium]|nr:MAG: gamma carbonic anhydrase family protein [Deltaproteobacteria bacterium GWA2_55_82]OGQ62931.1 MAG: gamma carbonic anhydrase family protein [Deltaproteobacteria bacterium RIFCSPLOWO2_02_FULL_55_12]OIJ72893.1 MAG: gamma carbonic anhydrase family protein [Deltaproteobacteria bacterium GWC2_55_46]HBG46176.1 gamma carbonic anhydrase family protein [Deltaproteobacteria bacterium]HCY11674.1 gamma carbonic anhydrase family protein [Deltaproteobacteria bacterium]